MESVSEAFATGIKTSVFPLWFNKVITGLATKYLKLIFRCFLYTQDMVEE